MGEPEHESHYSFSNGHLTKSHIDIIMAIFSFVYRGKYSFFMCNTPLSLSSITFSAFSSGLMNTLIFIIIDYRAGIGGIMV